MKEFKPRDKLTQRMTRDGAVLDTSFPLAVLKMGGFVPLPLWDGL